MGAADQQEIFFSTINDVEKDYQLYFGLKSIQKGLDQIESIYDHFKFDKETCELYFTEGSDLPEEIRVLILKAYHEIFFELNQA